MLSWVEKSQEKQESANFQIYQIEYNELRHRDTSIYLTSHNPDGIFISLIRYKITWKISEETLYYK